MSKRNIEAVYELSPMQQGMLFESIYRPESGVYVEQMYGTLRGDLDVEAFRRAWQAVLDRHTILRTSFAWKKLDRVLQVVQRQVELPFTAEDWRVLSPAEQAARLDAQLNEERRRGFNLAQAPLMRVALLHTADDAYTFVWSHHHILLDGWSLPLLLKEVFAYYEAFSRGQTLELAPPRPYRDYIAWLKKQDMAAAEAYWRKTLAGFTAPTPLAVDDLPVAGNGAAHSELEIRVSHEVTGTLEALARQHHLTLSTLVQGAWALLLSRYSGEDDVVFGLTVSGRPADLPGAESMVGLFINTLPVRVRISNEQPVIDWLKALQAQTVEMRQYEYSPLVEVQRWSDVEPGQPLFNSILVFENYPLDEAVLMQRGGLRVEDVHNIEQTEFPLTVVSAPGEELPLKISYDAQRFSADTILRMLGHLETLLEGIAADPRQAVGVLPLLPHAEQQQILVEWNRTSAPYPADQCAHELFEAQAARTPDAVALVFEGETMSYAELNRRANQLAHTLQARGVGPETLVGLCVERSFEMIVGILGVLKAGGAYLPLDPTFPPERLGYMLNDAGVRLVLTQAHLVKRLPEHNAGILRLDADWEEIARASGANPQSGAAPGNLAYVIYTSGSTGRPKGVLLAHRGLVNLIPAYCARFGLKPGVRFLQFSTVGFDGSVPEVFATLASGATLVLGRRETLLSPSELHALLRRERVNVATLPPALLSVLPADDLPDLEHVMSVGDRLTGEVAAKWKPGRHLHNGYGPTENTVCSVWHEVTDEDIHLNRYPIGRPFPNVRAYVLDAQLRPVPVGVPGELCVGGVALARGYLNRPELTAERFIADPFGAGGRLYRTGDRVRWLPDGTLEFLGRLDQQVKVRGFRVELGEIEAVLVSHPTVEQAAVKALGESPAETWLAAYIVPASGATPDPAALRAYLVERLPDYMVPTAYVVMDALPLNASGKVDRKALPAPEGAQLASAEYVAPRTPVEAGLAGIYASVLKVERVGVHDDFFALGGHSLLATQLVSRVRETFQVELPIRDLFDAPTVAGLAERVERALREEAGLDVPPLVPVEFEADPPLSFAQQRLWFLDQLAPGNLFYNLPLAVRLSGALDVEALQRALNTLVERHETLRTTFRAEKGEPVQVIADDLTLDLPLDDLTDLPESEREAEAQRLAEQDARTPFDLAAGPLLRARLIKLAEDEHLAVLVLHHIIADGWSLGVLVEEMARLYAAYASGQTPALPPLPVQYADYAHWQREWLQGEVLERQLAYWRKQFEGAPVLLVLPTDRPRPAVQTSNGATLPVTLPTYCY